MHIWINQQTPLLPNIKTSLVLFLIPNVTFTKSNFSVSRSCQNVISYYRQMSFEIRPLQNYTMMFSEHCKMQIVINNRWSIFLLVVNNYDYP